MLRCNAWRRHCTIAWLILPGCGLLPGSKVHLGFSVTDAILEQVTGIVVTSVLQPGNAYDAGIKQDDIIFEIEGERITSTDNLRQKLAEVSGDTAEIRYYRPGPLDETGKRMRGTKSTLTVSLEPTTADGSIPIYLGMSVADQDTGGVKITDVTKDGLSEKAGIKVGDVIDSINTTTITEVRDLLRALAGVSSGSNISMKLRRTGTENLIQTEIIASAAADASVPLLAMTVQSLTPDLATYFGFTASKGAKISQILMGSPALEKGLMVGDVIISITPPGGDPEKDMQEVTSAKSCAALLNQYIGSEVTLEYVRGNLISAIVSINVDGDYSQGLPVPTIGMSLEETSLEIDRVLRVETVDSSGPAASAGISEGDTIFQVGEERVETVAAFWRALLAPYSGMETTVRLKTWPQGDPTLPTYAMLRLVATQAAASE